MSKFSFSKTQPIWAAFLFWENTSFSQVKVEFGEREVITPIPSFPQIQGRDLGEGECTVYMKT